MTGKPFRFLFALSCLLLGSPAWGQQRDAAPGNQVTGRVIMDDGVPVPSSATVELRCNGRIRRRVRPFTNGDFAVLIGADTWRRRTSPFPAARTLSSSAAT